MLEGPGGGKENEKMGKARGKEKESVHWEMDKFKKRGLRLIQKFSSKGR